ncbi:MAG: hypothetical protein ABIR96_07605 [Bdellovibrionota bacterium]
MSRKLQGLLGEIKNAPFFPVYRFFLIFFVLKLVLAFLMEGAFFLGGYAASSSTQIVENNEVLIQSLALVIALWGVFARGPGASSRHVSLREFLGESMHKWPAPSFWVAESLSPIMLGFGIASFSVLLLLLSGFLSIEGHLSLASLLIMPAIVLRAALLVLWIALLELTRLKLSRLLVRSGLFEVVGLLALVIFEGYLLYSVMKTSGGALEQAFMGLVALWWSALLATWTLISGKTVLASWRRVCIVASLVVSLTCVYGFPLSWGRVASLTSVYEGPHPWSRVVLQSPSLLGQWSLILIFTAFFAAMLRRVLTQASDSRA